MREKDNPTRRALRMAAMTAGVTGSYLGYLAQRAFLGEAGRDRKLKATHTKAARRMTDEFSALRGPAMKLGQMLSLQTGVVPEEILAELATLQMQAPPMHPSLVRARFRASMGANPEDVFREFDLTPIAAASLGQVHRAVTKKGDVVAVKIQYPGMRSAIESDFKWFRAVSKPAQLSKYVPESLIDELQEQIVVETDYRREADNIDFFRERLRPLGFVRVPEVHRGLSSDQVLTMSLMPGEHLERYLARKPTQRQRDTLGANLLELFYFQLLQVEAFHADPHWGNYLFATDGTISLVDFGCVKYLTHPFVENLRAIFLFPGDRRGKEFKRLLDERYALHGQKLSPAVVRTLMQLSDGFYRKLYPPERDRDDTPFDFADAEVLREYLRESVNLTRAKAGIPEYVFYARAEMGLYQTLHRLRARVRTSAIVRKYLDVSSRGA